MQSMEEQKMRRCVRGDFYARKHGCKKESGLAGL